MLEDRSYMRRPSFRPRQSATVMLIIVNIAAFLVQYLVLNNLGVVDQYLALSVAGLKHWYLWQLISFQFLHAGVWHLIFNCLAIFWFGRSVEDAVGRKSFITLYLSSGVIGGLFQSLAMVALHQDVPVVGASAGGFGLIAAFAVLFPDTIIMLLLIIPMPAKFLLLLEAIIAIAGTPSTGIFVGRKSTGPACGPCAAWSKSLRTNLPFGARTVLKPVKNYRPKNSSARKWIQSSTKSLLTVSKA